MNRAKILTILICLFISLGFMAQPVIAEEPIKLGALFVMTGKLGGYGKSGWQSVQLAVEEINASGGILGRQIEATIEDTEVTPEKGSQIVRKYVMREKKDFIIGPTASSVGLAVADTARRLKVLHINTQSATHVLSGEEFSRYTFSVLRNTVIQSRSGAYFLAEKPYKKWMALVPDYSYGHSSWEMFIGKLQELNPEVEDMGKMAPKLGTDDFSSYIQRILDEKPDAVWCPLWGGDAVTFIKQANRFNLFDEVKFAFPVGASMEILVPLKEELPDGLYMSARYFFTDPDSVMNRDFVNKYYERYNEYPSYMGHESYAGVLFLKAAIERAGTTDTEAIVDAIEKEPLAWETPGGWRIMRAEDHQAVTTGFWGESTYSEEYGFAVLKNVRTIPAEVIVRTPEELKEVQEHYQSKQ